MQALSASVPFFSLVFAVLLACAAGQTVHGYLRIVHCSPRTQVVTVAYESAVLVHIVLMAAYALAQAGGSAADPQSDFLYFSVPLLRALWINVVVALVAAYAAFAGVEDDDLPVDAGDISWMPAIDAVLVLGCTPPAMGLFGGGWLFVMCLDAAYLLFRTCFLLLVDGRLRSRMVSSLSVAEAMKLLPEGLLYADAHGRTLVANDAMRHCLSALGLSTDFGRVDELWKLLNELAEGERAVPVAESVERRQGDWVLLRIGPNEVRLFSFEGSGFEQDRSYPSVRPLESGEGRLGESRRLLGSEVRMRVLAYDVTEEVDVLRAIDRANAALADSQRELQTSLLTVQEAAENEAMLRMRGRVHDVIGQRLSMLHRALEDEDVSDETLEQLKPLLSGILDDLAAGSHVEPADELSATVNAFALTGVAVCLEGRLPDDEATAKLFVDCIREGATNAVKHAHATLVKAVCESEAGVLTVTNDGIAPSGPIVEGTGLRTMRRAVESAGGTLAVETRPFALRVNVG